MVLTYLPGGSWQPTTQWASGLTDVTFTSPTPVQSAVTPIIGGNASPTGQAIPTGLGMVVVPGSPVIDPKHLGGYRIDGDRVLVNLVFCLLDTKLGGTFNLIWARANNQFIIRKQAPIRGINSPYRFYRGNQTKVDPLIKAFLAAEYRTAWPGFVYIVFENFDIAPYDNKVPIFDFQIGSDVTTAPSAEVESELTQGTIGGGFFNATSTVDFSSSRFYSVYQDNGDDAQISTIDISVTPPIETARVAVSGADPFGYVFDAISLHDSDYIVCTSEEVGTGTRQLTLIKISTGAIVDTLAPLLNGDLDPFEPNPLMAALLSLGKYHVFCGAWTSGTHPDVSGLAVAVADTVAESLDWVIHPYTAPAVGEDTNIFSIAIGPLNSTSLERTIFWTDGGTSAKIYQAKITDSSFTSKIVHTETDLSLVGSQYAVMFDFTDNGVCIYRDDGSIKKIAPGGGTVYETEPQSPTNLFINAGTFTSVRAFAYRARPGFSYGVGPFSGGDDLYEIDLSDGSITLIVDFSALTLTNWENFGHQFWDQYTLTMTGPQDPGVGYMNRLTFGDLTPNTIDLADIMLALTTFDGRNDVSETAFTNFPGSECYGVKYESDTSIQDALRALREPFDVSIVESDAKLKFRYPRRDGSYAVDATITADDIVDKGQFTIEKMAQTEEEALIECEISFYDKNNYGERNTANFPRPTGAYDLTKSINKRSFNLPLYMTASRAKQQAALIVYRSVYALESYNFTLGPGLAHLEPGDIISFPFASDAVSFDIIAQIKEAALNANYTQDISCFQYLQAHDATYTGAEIIIAPEEPQFSYITAHLLLEGGGFLRLEGDMQSGVTDALLLNGII